MNKNIFPVLIHDVGRLARWGVLSYIFNTLIRRIVRPPHYLPDLTSI